MGCGLWVGIKRCGEFGESKKTKFCRQNKTSFYSFHIPIPFCTMDPSSNTFIMKTMVKSVITTRFYLFTKRHIVQCRQYRIIYKTKNTVTDTYCGKVLKKDTRVSDHSRSFVLTVRRTALLYPSLNLNQMSVFTMSLAAETVCFCSLTCSYNNIVKKTWDYKTIRSLHIVDSDLAASKLRESHTDAGNQCWGSGSGCLWASRIRIH